MVGTTGKSTAGTRRGSGVSRVHAELRDQILDLTLPPGSPIDEISLAQRFKMSRTPIREALVRLAGEGLVTTLPNRSTVVAQIDFMNLPQFFDALTLMYRVTGRLAARDHQSDDLGAIEQAQAAFARAVEAEDALAMIAANRDLHLAIAAAGRNAHYATFFAKLMDEGRRILRFYYQSFGDQLPRAYVEEHDEIIDAIKRRDVEAADRLSAQHADQIVGHIRRAVAADRRDSVPL